MVHGWQQQNFLEQCTERTKTEGASPFREQATVYQAEVIGILQVATSEEVKMPSSFKSYSEYQGEFSASPEMQRRARGVVGN